MSSLFDNLAYKTQDDILEKIIKAVEDGYEAKKRPPNIVHKKSFSPSSIGYKHNRCPRLWVMKFAGRYREQDTTSLTSVAVMDNGTNRGNRIQEALEITGIATALEHEITYDDPPIRGFADVMAEVDGEPVVIEIKTTRTEAFESRKHSMKGPAYQMYQLLMYMYIEDIDKGVLLYENNNDRHLLAVPVNMTDENRAAVEKAFDWMRKVWDAHEKGLMPARPWKKTSPNCADCPLFNECWYNEQREDIKIKSMAVHNW